MLRRSLPETLKPASTPPVWVDMRPHPLAFPEAGLGPTVLVLQQPLLPHRLGDHGIQLEARCRVARSGGAPCGADGRPP